MPDRIRTKFSGIGLYAGVASALLFIIGLEISVTGYVPRVTDPGKILTVCWTFLFASLVLINLAFAAGFAHDIESGSRYAAKGYGGL